VSKTPTTRQGVVDFGTTDEHPSLYWTEVKPTMSNIGLAFSVRMLPDFPRCLARCRVHPFYLLFGVAVGDRVTQAPPRRPRRAAFPHRAPAEGRTRSRFGALAAHAPPIRRLATLVTRRIRR
jgi:hypothetical protein